LGGPLPALRATLPRKRERVGEQVPDLLPSPACGGGSARQRRGGGAATAAGLLLLWPSLVWGQALEVDEAPLLEGRLPWRVESALDVMGSDLLARGPRGAVLEVAPALPLGEGVEADTRAEGAPPPTEGSVGAGQLWVYAQAQRRSARGQHAQAGTLLGLLAPQAPHLRQALYLRAAQEFGRAGDGEAARAHLEAAGLPVGGLSFGAHAWVALAEGDERGAALHLSSALHWNTPPHHREGACEAAVALLDRWSKPSRAQEVAALLQKEPALREIAPSLGVWCRGELGEVDEAWGRLVKRLPKAQAQGLAAPPSLDEAERLMGLGRNADALPIIEAALSWDDAPTTQCRGRFLRGQALRKVRRKQDAGGDFVAAAERCGAGLAGDDPRLAGVRARALYWGARSLPDDDPRVARWLRALVEEFPKAQTADDAAARLARVERLQGREREAEAWAARLRAEWVDGDAAREFLWEPALESLRAGRDEDARRELESLLTLPPEPGFYRSGGVHYFLGRLAERRGDEAEALRWWLEGFSRAPATFHGQACAWALLERDEGRAKLAALPRPSAQDAAPVPFEVVGEVRGWARLGDFARAAQAQARLGRGDTPGLWLEAWLGHLAGQYPRSHNVARRRLWATLPGPLPACAAPSACFGRPSPASGRGWGVISACALLATLA
jgi:tetratricopeptide (TPR) repeat protein